MLLLTHQISTSICLLWKDAANFNDRMCGSMVMQMVLNQFDLLCSLLQYSCRFFIEGNKKMLKKKILKYAPTVGLEPTTTRLRALRSTN